jgi:hypothetical protein
MSAKRLRTGAHRRLLLNLWRWMCSAHSGGRMKHRIIEVTPGGTSCSSYVGTAGRSGSSLWKLGQSVVPE